MAALRRICALALASALLFGVFPASAAVHDISGGYSVGSSLGVSNVVYSEAELRAWWLAHQESGGTVYLGDNITLTDDIGSYSSKQKFIVETGSFGLTYNGGILISKRLELTGEGVEVPVLEIISVGWLYMGNWLNRIEDLRVTSTGRAGAGGVALRVSCDAGRGYNESMAMSGAVWIASHGSEAVGVELTYAQDLYGFNVSVEGENSMAVSAPQGTFLWLCRLSAVGSAARAAPDDVVLELCTASPAHPGLRQRQLLGMAQCLLYLPVEQHGDFINNVGYVPLIFSGGDQYGSLGKNFNVEWEDTNGIDTAVLGSTVISGGLSDRYAGIVEYPLELLVEVRDPALPCIYTVRTYEEGENATIHLRLWEVPVKDRDVLWCSYDDGDTWSDISGSPDVEWRRFQQVDIRVGKDSEPLTLQLESPAGLSNVVTVDVQKGTVAPNYNGGDRTGTDRGGADDDEDDDPPVPPPPPDDDDDDPPPPGDDDDDNPPAQPPPPPDDDDDDPPAQPPPPPGGNDNPPPTPPGNGGDGGTISPNPPGGETDPPAPKGKQPGADSGTRGSQAPDSGPVYAGEETIEREDIPLPQPAAVQTAAFRNQAVTSPQAKEIPASDYRAADTLRFTGAEVADLIKANPVQVTFIRHGVRVVVPTADLSALALAPGQELVVIVLPVEDGYRVIILLDGAEVDLPYTLHLSATTEPPEAVAGTSASVLALPATGDLPAEPPSSTPVLPVAAGIALPLGGLGLALRRRLRS